MQNISVTDILRKSTKDIHKSIESTPFAQAVLKKELTLETYLGYIRALAIIHAALEGCLNNCHDSRIVKIWSSEMQRSSLLNDDNDYFRWKLIPDSLSAVESALEAAAHIRKVAGETPIALAGAIYVLMGSTKGAVIMLPLIKKALSLDLSSGLSYLSIHGGQGPEHWESAARVMNELITNPQEIEVVDNTAKFIFRQLHLSFKALLPLQDGEKKYHATTFNPESGTHPVPQNKQDLVAVLRASDKCLSEYPYFVYRYGKRGRRYTDADGAWLVTLADLKSETLHSQIDWLGGVLSNRGMPRVLMARHLEILVTELLFISAGDDPRIKALASAAENIRNDLERHFPGHIRKFRALNLEKELGRSNDFSCFEALDLISSAVVDETDGVNKSIESLVSWLADANRFSQQWVLMIKKEVEYLKRLMANGTGSFTAG